MCIEEYCPRIKTREEVKEKTKARDKVSNDVADFLAKGGIITDLDARTGDEVEGDKKVADTRASISFNRDGMPLSKNPVRIFESNRRD